MRKVSVRVGVRSKQSLCIFLFLSKRMLNLHKSKRAYIHGRLLVLFVSDHTCYNNAIFVCSGVHTVVGVDLREGKLLTISGSGVWGVLGEGHSEVR